MYDQIDYLFSLSRNYITTFNYLAGIGVIIKVVRHAFDSPTDYIGYFKWLPLAALFFGYDHVVEAIFDISREADKSVSYLNSSKTAKLFLESAIDDKIKSSSVLSLPSNILAHIFETLFLKKMAFFILIILILASNIAYVYYKIKVLVNMIKLIVFGPLQISISFFDGFNNQWRNWLSELIETSMYLPVIFIIDWIAYRILENAFKPIVELNTIEQLTKTYIGIVFFGLVLTFYFKIEKITKSIITRGASGSAGRKIAAAAMMIVRKATIKV